MKTPKLHVALVASPGMGHITPCLELAKCLVSLHDVEVTFFVSSTQSSVQQIKVLQSQTFPKGLNLITLPPIDISSIFPSDIDLPSRITRTVQESLPAIRSTILESSCPPRVMIADVFSTHAFEIADELKMAKYLFFTSNATVLAFMAYVPKLFGEIQNDASQLGEWIRVPGCKPMRTHDTGGYLLDPYSGGDKCMLEHQTRYTEASGILINTFEDLESDTLEAFADDSIRRQIPLPPVYSVGPLIKKPSETASASLAWLDKQPLGSVIFVSFGSGGALSAEQTNELAWGLELSQQRFIWVTRPPQEVANATYLSTGNGLNDPYGYLPDGFIKRTQGHGLVVPNWVPQVEVLSHPSIGAFLSHCGWNSTLESIAYGVPLITWPLHAEQYWNASLLSKDMGIGLRLKLSLQNCVIGRYQVARIIRMMMEGEEGKALKCRAKELKCSASKAVEKTGTSYESLSHLVKKWETQA